MLRFNETRKLTTHNRSVPSSNLGGATKLEKPEQFTLLWLFAFLSSLFFMPYSFQYIPE